MLRSLYAKLVFILFILLTVVALSYSVLTQILNERASEVGSQQLHRELAADLRDLLRVDGSLDKSMLKQMLKTAMVINPSVEIYLLDRDGNILAASANPEGIERNAVSLAPIREFLGGKKAYPLLGDDPREQQRKKIFSAARVVNNANEENGYLYVVLQSEEYEATLAQSGLASSQRWLGISALLVSLIIGLMIGLLLFSRLTKRTLLLSQRIGSYRESTDLDLVSYPINSNLYEGDELDQLEASFEVMKTRIEQQLVELEQQDAKRRELVANVSHDLRTPVAALHGYLESLQHRWGRLSDEEKNEYVDISLRHSQRLGRLIDDLFELAKLDAYEHTLDAEAFSIIELVHDIVQKYKLTIDTAGLVMVIDSPDRLPFVQGDIALIERAITNLLDNAIQHTEAGGRIIIKLIKQHQAVGITIKDTGRGIPEEELVRIFNRFYQVGNSHRAGVHAGLGLAITKRIIELHHRNITVTSPKGLGAQFHFSLPQISL